MKNMSGNRIAVALSGLLFGCFIIPGLGQGLLI